jgi:hypothetical protein
MAAPVHGRNHTVAGQQSRGGPPGERNGQYRHGERTKAAIAGAAEIQRIAEKAPRWLTYLNGSMPRDATLIRSITQLEASISDVNLTCGTGQQAPPYGSWPSWRL